MIQVKSFERLVLTLGPWSAPHIDQVTRQLREHRMLPTGGRGLNAPDMDSGHATNILIALTASEKAVAAHRALMVYAPMCPKPNDFDFLGCDTFAGAFEKILGEPALAYRVDRIVVCLTWPEAKIFSENEDGGIQVQRYAPAEQPDTGYGRDAYVTAVITGGMIHQISIDLLSDDEESSDWTGNL